jgi:hypothetical protein
MNALYDTIGAGYAKRRLPDPRITEPLLRLLGLRPPAVLADIGAGTGG